MNDLHEAKDRLKDTHADVAELLPASLQSTQQSQVSLLSGCRLQQTVIDGNALPQVGPGDGPRR